MIISTSPVLESRASLYIEHKTTVVDGVRIFYRESGPKEGPAIVLLHGFPSSSRMFLDLIPTLARTHRVIAPDYPGFGHSDAPSPRDFAYTFERLAEFMAKFIDQIAVTRYALYLQDYGGPIGFRLALARPERVTALIVQNAVAHLEGLSDVWAARKLFWSDRLQHEEKMRAALLSQDSARQRHMAGALHPDRIDPDTWSDEFAFLTRPGMAEIQLELVYDYQQNVAAYPQWQAYLREHQPPTLVVWGKRDPLFTIAGALAFGQELPLAEIHLLNASHFALDEESHAIAWLVSRFMQRIDAPAST